MWLRVASTRRPSGSRAGSRSSHARAIRATARAVPEEPGVQGDPAGPAVGVAVVDDTVHDPGPEALVAEAPLRHHATLRAVVALPTRRRGERRPVRCEEELGREAQGRRDPVPEEDVQRLAGRLLDHVGQEQVSEARVDDLPPRRAVGVERSERPPVRAAALPGRSMGTTPAGRPCG